MKVGTFLALAFLGMQLSPACSKNLDSAQEQSPSASNNSQHKVVHVDWQAQLADIQKRLAHDPNSASLHNQAAVIYNALGDFDSFEREIHTAMKLDPKNSIHWYVAFAAYQQRHLRDNEMSVLEAALQIDPENPIGHRDRAILLEDDKKWAAALAEYDTTKKLLEEVRSDQKNLRGKTWFYTDSPGNFFDVTLESAQIDEDIRRIQTETVR